MTNTNTATKKNKLAAMLEAMIAATSHHQTVLK